MSCPVCSSENVNQEFENITLNNLGLENVHLENVPVVKCSDCGFVSRVMPKQKVIKKEIAESICVLKRALTGAEFSYLRKFIGLTGLDAAKILGVSNVSISRWENGEHEIHPCADRLMKTVVLSELNRTKQLKRVCADTGLQQAEDVVVDVNRFASKEMVKIKTGYSFRDGHRGWLIKNSSDTQKVVND